MKKRFCAPPKKDTDGHGSAQDNGKPADAVEFGLGCFAAYAYFTQGRETHQCTSDDHGKGTVGK